MADEATGMSKSAKRRAAKKAREAENEPPAEKENTSTDVNKGKPKAQAKAAAEPAPAAKAKAKAEPKAAPKAEPKAEPKAAEAPKPKADAKPKAEPKKSAAKAKAKAAPAPPPMEEKKKEPEVDPFITFDDGTGGDWEVATAVSKKQQSRIGRKEEEKKMMADLKAQTVAAKIPGMGPGQTIPGMAPVAANKVVTVQPGASQLVTAAPTAAAAEESAQTKADMASATVKVPEARIGIVIGPKGSKIKQIQEKTGVTRIDTSGELFTITGKAADVEMAKKAIEDLVEKGYTALTYENFSENQVMVHPSHFPDIIGKQGAIIRKLKEELGVEVTIPPTPKTGNLNASTKKYKVTIAGTREGVDKAKEVINDIMTYYHHELTHPGEVHEEVEVEEWQYPFIIGKGGCEMRHVQKSYHVRMYIPREVSTNKNVVIVGDKGCAERAKAYVDRQLENSWTASRGRDRQDKADDGWGDEEEEDWMKQYMYKR